MTAPLWTPPPGLLRTANITSFARRASAQYRREITDYESLYRWSVDSPAEFWSLVWDECGVIGHKGESVVIDQDRMPGARWFPDATLNFAENLLRARDDVAAIVFRNETGLTRTLSRRWLYDEVSRLAQALTAVGVGQGDRVVAFMPNIPEAIVAMLATTTLGALWSSCSPDFGTRGVVERFGQIEPKVLFTIHSHQYNGKQIECRAVVRDVVESLPSLQHVVMLPYLSEPPTLPVMDRPVWSNYSSFMEPFPAVEIKFEPFPFNHPLYILYSSGTTGAPKCIVHGAGGTLLQHLKEHQLHTDIGSGDCVFYFTSTGWMMWNWLVSALASGATVALYDGSPLHPHMEVLLDYVDDEHITVFGTSAKYLDALRKAGTSPAVTHGLRALRTILSTGSPLAPESFDYVYQHFKTDIRLCSISGGTDIISCFALGCPTLPVWRGELQCRGLGMRVEVYDDEGRSITSQKGELVCAAPFPSMPLGFWNDPGDQKYQAAYFERYPGVWHHGDYVELTEHGGMIFYGRSDAVLNPSGVRIGTAELYRVVEQFDEVVESIAIAQEWEGDVRIVLFVRLRAGQVLDTDLTDRMRQRVRAQLSPRHVPAVVVQVRDIPRTKSGKIVELAVREAVHHRPVRNLEALANPEALDEYRDWSGNFP